MRITGGITKGRRLGKITGLTIRPTSDMVRESIFDILGQTLPNCRILDLFAGTGSLGIESLSRGGKIAVFVDNSSRALAMIKKNLSICGFDSLSMIVRKNLPNGLTHIQDLGCSQFDVVFIDPPYGKGYIKPTMHTLINNKLLAEDSRIVVESSKYANDPFPTNFDSLHLKQTKFYGSTVIAFYSNYEER
ncbi:MAG: 16S rRNA (guanine(966)-N(2))-methyltransferase RsmD [Thermodesulfobacteriota bacterium]